MKYKVIDWVDYEDKQFKELTSVSYHVRKAIIDELREKGYIINGFQHQEFPNCTPLLNSGEKVCFSQRGWGQIMADALYLEQKTGLEYSYYAFNDDNINTNCPPQKQIDKKQLEIIKKDKLADEYFINVYYVRHYEIFKSDSPLIRICVPQEFYFVDKGDKLEIDCGKKLNICAEICYYTVLDKEEVANLEKNSQGMRYIVSPDFNDSKYFDVVAFKTIKTRGEK